MLFTPLVLAQTVNSVTGSQDNLNFTPQVSIPGSEFVKGQGTAVSQDTSTICNYLIAIYKYLIGIVAIFAAVALIIGGVIWITAAGSPGRIGIAKSWIASSLAGLALALGAFLILATINPELVICRYLKIDNIKNVAITSTPTNNTSLDTQACEWGMAKDAADKICGPGLVKKDNQYCKGLSYQFDSIMPNSYPQPNWPGYYCCCADPTAFSKPDYCASVGQGATCYINNGWGYCEDVNGKTICRPCKAKLGNWAADEASAKKVPEKFRCYYNNKNFECPDKKGVCGYMGNGDVRDCNSNTNGLSTGVNCWKINDITNLGLGIFFVQCRCQ